MTSTEGVGMDHTSESTPLLSHHAPNGRIPARLQRRVQVLLCVFAFIMMLGDNLQPAALTQVMEDAICDDYYARHISVATTGETSDRCKVHAVQMELAQVRGYQQLVPLFAALVCTVPYGLLAERIGRKRVLVLSGAGVCAALGWVLAVCFWRFASVRWVWLSGAFLFVGGGDAVTSSLVHIMVTDVTGPAERAQIFLFLHAADVLAGFCGPAISAALMEKGHVWTVLLLAAAALLAGTFLLTPFIPETLAFRTDAGGPAASPAARIDPSSEPITKPTSIWDRISRVLAPALTLTSNRQALLLLGVFAPQTAARDLFTMVGLQYSRAKFALPYGRGNVLLSVFQGAQGLVVLVLLPFITRWVADPRGWTPWARDRRYAIVSVVLTAAGLMVIAMAPGLVVEAAGLLLVACGSCTTGLLMSLLGGAVHPSQVSTVYSAALMLSIVVSSVAGPVANALLVEGLVLGWVWMGLPFAVAAVGMAGVAVAGLAIKAEKPEVSGDGEGEDEGY
ncbi:MFS transporter [Aspergillus homomorphus CBS 101889]|uniref:MFS general substrate transporter n=1 Tax=Aspergillus homomorphus (strain CBS 101889) TaxID=1450537 RepID=A0A395HYY0_ASPHC|nr:MFS general substrate transporter [Aspergillus homomorphus CBS 101889]RAL12729.1 MFS general substrate transporter [Aspergillus homomorphus CBS 101889]